MIPPPPMRKILATYRDAYSGLPTAVWWLSAAMLIHRSGTMVLPFLTLYFTRELELGVETAGILVAAWGVGAMVGSYAGGWAADRFGPLRVQVASLLAWGVGLFALQQMRSPVSLGIGLFVIASIAETFRPANASLLIAVAPAGGRTRAVALNRLAVNLGMAIGPSAGGFIAGIDYALLFWVDGATCLLAACVLLAQRHRFAATEAEHREARAQPAGSSPWRDRPFLVCIACCTLSALVFLQLLTSAPIYYREAWGLREQHIGLLFAINPVCVVLFEMVLVHRLARPNPLRIVALGALLTGVGIGIMPLGSGAAFAVLTVLVWTAGEMLEHPFVATFVAERGDARSRGRYLGVFQLSFAVAFFLAPIVGTQVYQHFGPEVLWAGCGVVGALAAAGYFAVGNAVDNAGKVAPDGGSPSVPTQA